MCEHSRTLHRHCTDTARTLHGHCTDVRGRARTCVYTARTCTDTAWTRAYIARTPNGHACTCQATNKYNIIHVMSDTSLVLGPIFEAHRMMFCFYAYP